MNKKIFVSTLTLSVQLQQKTVDQTAAAESSSSAAKDLLASMQQKVDYWTEQTTKVSTLKSELEAKLNASAASATAANKEIEVLHSYCDRYYWFMLNRCEIDI